MKCYKSLQLWSQQMMKFLMFYEFYKVLFHSLKRTIWTLPRHARKQYFCGLWQSLKFAVLRRFPGAKLLIFYLFLKRLCAPWNLSKGCSRHVASSMLTFALQAPWDLQFCSPNTKTIKTHQENIAKAIADVSCTHVYVQHDLSASHKQCKTNGNRPKWQFIHSKNTKILKICQLYMQIWTGPKGRTFNVEICFKSSVRLTILLAQYQNH